MKKPKPDQVLTTAQCFAQAMQAIWEGPGARKVAACIIEMDDAEAEDAFMVARYAFKAKLAIARGTKNHPARMRATFKDGSACIIGAFERGAPGSIITQPRPIWRAA